MQGTMPGTQKFRFGWGVSPLLITIHLGACGIQAMSERKWEGHFPSCRNARQFGKVGKEAHTSVSKQKSTKWFSYLCIRSNTVPTSIVLQIWEKCLLCLPVLRAELLVLVPLLHSSRQENFYNIRDTLFYPQPEGLSRDRGYSIAVYVSEQSFLVGVLVKLVVVRCLCLCVFCCSTHTCTN